MDGNATARIDVDGRTLDVDEGKLLVDALDGAGIALEHVCYHPALGPLQTCDTCMVKVDGELKRACATQVSDGMRVSLEDSASRAARAEAMHRLLGDHNLYCTVCDNNNGDCEVHNATRSMGIEHQRYPFTAKGYPVDRSNPFYLYDPDQCILCGRCVEACQNVQVTETLSIDWEAERPRVLWDGGSPIDESSCVSCGHCVTVCPCNALMEKSMLGEAGLFTGMPDELKERSIEMVKAVEPQTGFGPILALSEAEERLREGDIERTKTVCTYCGVGCAFEVWTKERQILKINPVPEAPANGISTCVKGKFGWDFVNAHDRLMRPLIRDGGRFREASWDEALDVVARRLGTIQQEHGGEALGFIASSKSTNEQAYLLQKLARAVFKSNSVDNDARYCQAPATKGLFRTVGYGGDAGTMAHIERAALVLAVGTNTADSHPVLAAKIRRRQKRFGQKLIVADLLEHEMAKRADIFLRPNAGTDQVWLQAVARHILERGLEDRDFLDRWVHEVDAFRDSLEPYTLAYAEEVTGIPADTLRQAAEMIAAAESVCGLWAMGVTQHAMGSDTSTAISNLLLVTGNYGRPGTGGYPLRGHNNVQGVSDFGALWQYFPGYDKVSDPEARARFERAWGEELPTDEGFNNYTMIQAIHDGDLHGLYVVGEDLALVDGNADHVMAALAAVDFLVVQEVFMTRTAEFADVVLPSAVSLEKDGTFVNTEKRIQRLYRAMEPLGECRPDWEIIQDVARRMGHDWGYRHPSEVMDEVASCTPMFAGVSYERLEGFKSLVWPVAADGTDSPLLYTERFNFEDGKARLHPISYRPPHERPDETFDLLLNNGRILEHFHEGNLTWRVPGLAHKVPGTFVEVSEELAAERGLHSGDRVRLVSRRDSVEVPVQVSARVRGKELYMPHNSRLQPVNVLTSGETDPDSSTPAYKECAVRMEKLAGGDGAVLGRQYHRGKDPTPQAGVAVERKWERADYSEPGRMPAEGD